MVKKIHGVWLTFFLLVAVTAVPAAGKKVLVHYMPWFSAKPVSHAWGWHWAMDRFNPDVITNGRRQIAAHYYPAIGPYDSSDPVVLEYHTLLMKLAGIDGVIVDWYGTADFFDYAATDTNTWLLFRAAQRAGLDFCICYEDQTITQLIKFGKLTANGAIAQAQQDMRRIERQYLGQPAYLRHQNQPVLMTYGPQYFSQGADWQTIFTVLRAPVSFVTLDHLCVPASRGAYAWPPMWLSQNGVLAPEAMHGYLTAFENKATNWQISVAAAFPQFHDIYRDAGKGDGYGRLQSRNGQTFRETLARGLTNACTMLQLATWNDFGEGTMIEPTREFGFLYLGIMQEARRQYIDPAFPGTTNDLQVVGRLYNLRRRYAGQTSTQARLDAVAAAIVSNQITTATMLLAAIEQPLLAGRTNAPPVTVTNRVAECSATTRLPVAAAAGF
ncbi:MAG: glycoside hydrolase family 71/99-like protein [bacterium]|nr:glycoside hydrolase family 71/99-like protein [bacterium]